jgi:hypothetical protein
LLPDPYVEVVTEDTADDDLVLFVIDVVDVTTVPEASNWFAPKASIIETSSTVAPLMKISSDAELIWNKDPNDCPD